MDVLKSAQKTTLWLGLSVVLTSCQINYIAKSAYNQFSMMSSQVPLDEALKDPKLTDEQKRKIQLAQKAREFAEKDLALKPTKNYTNFVLLDRPYVTYVVSAAPKWKLETYKWRYPIVGSMPYKGFFNEADAKKEQEELQKENLDTYMRGVSAYSTLGWFKDPLLSSMLQYKDYDLVNTIIHETVHATLFIKHEADFNERMAVFIGNLGAEMYYQKVEGPDSPTLQNVKNENADDKLFSAWLSVKLKALEAWYENLPKDQQNDELRQQQFTQLQEDFKKELLPQLKTETYKKFQSIKLNNARLLVYRTYMQDLDDFQKLYEKTGKDFNKFLEECKSLEKEKDPAKALKQKATSP
ncbi:aminopeptidase [Bdellovibrio sp. HCB337]|uniref:aminopeptidase n=1 Tax=Bdellovibrio sp. HCB337 TaxID=3394358 RepID=UPI0039A73C8C